MPIFLKYFLPLIHTPSIGLSEKNLERRAILKDLIILLGKGVQD